MKKTIVWGVSLKSHRYSHIALKRLVNSGVETLAFGLRPGQVEGVEITTDAEYFRTIPNIHTISLYVSATHQGVYLPIWLNIKPERIIFNPGTENPSLYPELEAAGIQVEEACTLVLLSTGQY
jgi:predicted CoA-binding protein